MKRILINVLLVCLIFSFGISKEKKILIIVKNNSSLKYSGEVVAVDWKLITNKDKSVTGHDIMVIEKNTGKNVPSQIVDNNGDGKTDELLLLTGINAGETKEFYLVPKDEAIKYDTIVSLKFVKGREDIAWESDRIAYRMYGPAMAKDVNNGIDIWTKRVKYPIVEKWYAYSEKYAKDGKDTYHQDTGEGADFYSVGKSLGAGSAALWKDDSLYQPGVFDSYKFLESGPIRIVFEVNYKPVLYDVSLISEKKRISIDAGSNLNKIEVIYAAKDNKKIIEMAAGIVKRKGVTSYVDKKNGIASLWGATTDDPVNEFLGIGIVFPGGKLINAKDNEIHLLMIGKSRIDKPITYYSGAGWTRSGDFKSENDWKQYLNDFSKKLKNKLLITVK